MPKLHIFEAGLLATGAFLAIFNPGEQVQCYAGVVVGAGLASLFLSAASKIKGDTLKYRFAIHGSVGIIFGPAVAFWASTQVPEYPIGSIATVAGGLCGVAGVVVLQMIPSIAKAAFLAAAKRYGISLAENGSKSDTD